jgi:hypothetical protein
MGEQEKTWRSAMASWQTARWRAEAEPHGAVGSSVTSAVSPNRRDLRLDFFRGLALFIIFIDHVPGNVLSHFTLRSIGFSDAAEVFIFISGFTAAMVFGQALLRRGAVFAAAQIYRRVWQLYVAHLVLFVIFMAEVSYTITRFNNPMYTDEMGIGNFLNEPHLAIINALVLRFQPTFLDILPLYIVLLAVFPFILVGLARSPWPVLIASAALYAATQKYSLTFHGYPPGFVWYFNPFAWQFLFVIGAMCGYARVSGAAILPPGRWPFYLAAAVAGVGAVISLSWAVHYYWSAFPGLLFDTLWPYTLGKRDLSPLRLADFIALAVVTMRLIPRDAASFRSAAAWPAIVCGQHSLQIFCVGILLSAMVHVVMTEFDDSLGTQIALNAAGLGVMIAIAWLLDWYKNARHEGEPPAMSPTAELT